MTSSGSTSSAVPDGDDRVQLTPTAFESPSLQRGVSSAAGAAFEVKFLLDEALAAAVEDWARRRLVIDPHGDPARGGAYRTTSLYCDTPELDVYRRTPGYKRRKFRLRRYGEANWVYFERKSKSGDRVSKRRTIADECDITRLAESLVAASLAASAASASVSGSASSPSLEDPALTSSLTPIEGLASVSTPLVDSTPIVDALTATDSQDGLESSAGAAIVSAESLDPSTPSAWHGAWFERNLARRRLGPACVVSYDRMAFAGECSEGPLRLTLDRQLRGELTDRWGMPALESGKPLLVGKVIVEMKFRLTMPTPFKQLVAELGITPGPVSKYRLCRETQ